MYLFPCFIQAQIKGIEYQIKAFRLDSLLSISYDTVRYMKAIDELSLNYLLESDISQAVRVFAVKKKYDKALSYAYVSIRKGQDAAILQYYFPLEYRHLLLDDQCNLQAEYHNEVPIELIQHIDEIRNLEIYCLALHDNKKLADSVLRFIDSTNKILILAIIDKYGFITERKHGTLFNKFYFIAVHSFLNSKENYEF